MPTPAQLATEAFRRKSMVYAPGGDADGLGRRKSVVLSPLIQEWPQNGEYFSTPTASKRHWNSFQEHADRMFNGSDSVLATPMIDERREGFNWDTIEARDTQTGSASDQHLRMPPMREPKNSARNWRRDSVGIYGGNSNPSLPSAMRTMSTASTIDARVARSDTGLTALSSISSVDQGPRRAVPDIRMPDLKASDAVTPGEPVLPRPQIRQSRSLSLKLSSAMKKGKADDRPQKHAQFTEATTIPPISSNTSPGPRQGRLKERRRLERTDSLKLTLPLELPNLPPRGRSPVPKIVETPSLAAPRKRSPKTPWVRDMADHWGEDEDPQVDDSALKVPEGIATLPPSLLSTRLHSQPSLARSRRARNTTGTSDSATVKSDSTNPPVQEIAQGESEVLPRQEKKKSRIWLWIGEPRTSSVGHRQDAGRSSLWHLIRRSMKKHHSKVPHAGWARPPTLPANRPSVQNSTSARNESISKKDQIASLPMPPPRFTPPGLNRILTPPVCIGPDCDDYDVKGKLEGFFFDVLDIQQPKRKGVPGGIWDSDALLMPQSGGFTPSELSSDESPQGVSPIAHTLTTAEEISSLSPTSYMVVSPPPLSAHLDIPRSPMPGSRRPSAQNTPSTYFRVPTLSHASSIDELDEIERAKFEWLVPEHLPSSPLCPLHPKYRGPIGGTCLYHERTKEAITAAVAASQLTQAAVGA